MLEFFVVTRESNLDFDLQRIPMTQPVQSDLTTLFEKQRDAFAGTDTELIEFEPTFSPKKDELFEIADFMLPTIYPTALSTPQAFDELDNAFQDTAPIVKAIVGVDNSDKCFYFQSFNRSHILDLRRTLFLRSNTFQQMKQPAVQIDSKLAAVFRDGNLYFRSFTAVRQFLPLEDVFTEATDEDVRLVLEHDKLFVGDADTVVSNLTPRARKKFSLVIASKILDHSKATPKRIQNRSKKFDGLDIKTKSVEGVLRIIFPDTNVKIEYLLRFLAEEFYISQITEQPRATNSHQKYRSVAAK